MQQPQLILAYRLVFFIFTLPIGCAFAAFMWVYSRFVSFEDFDWNAVPQNAILYSTHTEVYLSCWDPKFHHRKGNQIFTIGFHGFTPYLWIPWHTLVGISWEIYSLISNEKPSDQLVRILERRWNERMMIFTDAGGPYGRVRGSLIKLAQRTDRPLVAFRHTSNRSVTIMKHQIPRPLSKVRVTFSQTISAKELKNFPNPLEEIQKNFDDIGNRLRSGAPMSQGKEGT